MSSRSYKDGTVFNSNTRLNEKPNESSRYKNYGTYKAAILRSYPKDDPNNRYKRGVEYDAIITSGIRKGELVRNIPPMCGFGGDKNFNEVVFQPKTKVLRGQDRGDMTPPEDTDSSHIVLTFLAGNYNFPLMLGAWPQPNNEEYGATQEDGTRILGQFQGLKWNVDKNGKLTLSFKDNSIEFDGPSGNLTITTKSKTTINADSDVEINSKSNAKINAQGNVDVQSTGPTSINAASAVNISGSGAVSISGSGGVSLSGPSVTLGGGGQPVPLGTDLINYLNTHTHPGDNTPPTQSFNSVSSVVSVG